MDPATYTKYIIRTNNNDVPFEVSISEHNHVIVKKEGPGHAYSEVVLEITCSNVIVGECQKEDGGSSILIEMSNQDGSAGLTKYIFIGREIFEFLAFSKIVKHVSNTEEGTSINPYAVDELDNIYLLASNAVIRGSKYTNLILPDPYLYYHWSPKYTVNSDICVPKMHTWWVDGVQYTCHHAVDPAEMYDYITDISRFHEGRPPGVVTRAELYRIMDDDQLTKILTQKEEFIQILKSFGECYGLESLIRGDTIHERIQ